MLKILKGFNFKRNLRHKMRKKNHIMQGIIHAVCTQNFPKKYFLLSDLHRYVCVSGDKKCLFYGKFCVHIKWINLKLFRNEINGRLLIFNWQLWLSFETNQPCRILVHAANPFSSNVSLLYLPPPHFLMFSGGIEVEHSLKMG